MYANFFKKILREYKGRNTPVHKRELENIINISLRNKYVYIQTPKCACSTIKRTLHKYEVSVLSPPPHVPVHPSPVESPFIKPYQLSKGSLMLTLQSKDFFKFSFVRNPYTRVLSAYLDKINTNQKPKEQIIMTLWDKLKPMDTQISFESFLGALQQIDPLKMDPHWRPMHLILLHNNITLDYIGKIENFDFHWGHVSSKIGLPFSHKVESFVRHQTSAKDLLDQYYTPDLKRMVADLYRKDFELYGYSV